MKTSTARTFSISVALALLLTFVGIGVLIGLRPDHEEIHASRSVRPRHDGALGIETDHVTPALILTSESNPILEESEEDRAVSIRGRVTSPARGSVGGARVIAINMEDWTAVTGVSQHEMMSGGQDPRRTVARLLKRCEGRLGDSPHTRSKKDGSFEFSELAASVYRLFVTHESSLPNGDTWVSVELGHPVDVEVKLVTGHSIVGRVADENGNPIGNVTVRATPSYEPRRGIGKLVANFLDLSDASLVAGARVSTTRGDGKFELRTLEPIAYDLDVRGGGFLKTMVTDIAAGTGEEIDVGLSLGASLTARVLDSRDRVVDDVQWSLRPVESLDPQDPNALMNMPVDLVDDTQRGTTDAEGKLSASGLEPGPYEIAISVEGSAPTLYEVDLVDGMTDLGDLVLERSPMTVREDEVASTDVETTRPSQVVRGFVVDPEGKSVRHARVCFVLRGMPSLVVPSVGTTRDGSFEIAVPVSDTGVMPPALELVATRQGYAPGREPLSSLVDSENESIVITLSRGATVSGRITDSSGNVVVGAQARLIESSGFSGVPDARQDLEALMRCRDARVHYSDANGEYRFSGTEAGTYAIEVRAVNLSPVSLSGIEVDGDELNRDIVLEVGQVLSVAAAGVDVDSSTLRVTVVSAVTTSKISNFQIGVAGDSRHVNDPEGTVTFDRLAAGRHRVVVSAPGYQYTERVVDVREAADSEVEIALRPGHRVHFLVLGKEGGVIEGARVSCARGPRESVQDSASLVTGADGRVTVTALNERSYKFSVEHPLFLPSAGQQLVARLPEDAEVEIVVTMETAGSVVGELALRDGQDESARHTLQLLSVEERVQGARGPVLVDDINGTFQFDGVRPGSYRIVMTSYTAGSDVEVPVDTDGNPVAVTVGTAEVVAGEVTHVELEAL